MVQVEWLIAGIDPKARHFLNLVTAPNVLLPIGPGQVNAAKRNQKAGSVLAALGRQPSIAAIHVVREQRLETTSPGLDDSMLLELRDQGFRVAILQCAKWPVEEIDIGIDDSRDPGGSGNSDVAAGALCLQWLLASKGNSGGAQHRVLQKTAAIKTLHGRSGFHLSG